MNTAQISICYAGMYSEVKFDYNSRTKEVHVYTQEIKKQFDKMGYSMRDPKYYGFRLYTASKIIKYCWDHGVEVYMFVDDNGECFIW